MSANTSSYNKILKLAKRINSNKTPLQSILSGLPQQIYSHNTKKIEYIGTHTYTGFTRFLKNHFNEFSNPTDEYEPILDILKKYQKQGGGKIPDNYHVQSHKELELIANIMDKLASDTNSQNTVTNNPMTAQIHNNEMFEYVAPTDLNGHNWKGALLLQHPMSVSEFSDGPSVIMGLDIQSRWDNDPKTGDFIEVPFYVALQLNQQTVLSLEYVIKPTYRSDSKYMIKTSHGSLIVPRRFHELPLYHGGDETIGTTEVLTTCRFCKGIPILGGKFYWNPDLTSAERMIDAGHATIDQFRFFQGKMMWNSDLFKNVIIQRNIYSPFVMKHKIKSSLAPDAINAIWKCAREQRDMQWTNILKSAPSEWNQWIQIQTMLKTSDELNELKQLHNQSISKQVDHFQTRN